MSDSFVATYPVSGENNSLKEIQEKKKNEMANLDPGKEPVVKEKKQEFNDLSNETPSEVAARAQGWVPENEWGGNPADWRPAEIFLERGTYFDTMKKQSKEIKKLQKALDEQARHTKMIIDKAVEQKLKELERDKARAVEDGDYSRAASVEKEITETKTEQEKETIRKKEVSEKERNQLLTSFVTENPWYSKDTKMKAYADMVAAGYAQVHGTNDIEEVLEHVIVEVRERFPKSEYFDNASGSRETENDDNGDEQSVPSKKEKFTSRVASSSRSVSQGPNRRGKNKGATAADLNTVQRQVGQRWVDAGAIDSLDAYAKSLQEMGEIE
jgi:hypothetical protein